MASQRRPSSASGPVPAAEPTPPARTTPPPAGTPSELAAAVATALRLSVTAAPGEAAAVLAPHVTGLSLDHVLADADLAETCLLYATVVTGAEQLRAAHLAYHAHHVRYPCGHPRRLAAAAAYGTALHQHGRLPEAIVVRRRVLAGYRTHQPHNALPAAVALADSLHAIGHCAEAIDLVGTAWDTWRRHPHADLTTGTTILNAYIRMLRACRHDLSLLALLAQARDTSAWSHRAATHTTEDAAADTTYIDAHRIANCTHTPQLLTGHAEATATLSLLPPHRSVPRRTATGEPAPGRIRRRRHPLAGYRASDIAAAFSRLLTAPESAILLNPDRPPHPDDAAARHRLTEATAAYLAHRRGLRAALSTAAILLPAAAVLLVLHLT
ncbi:hypothetical protein [Actinoplanes sp. HUAS TT8]|uniref:hypothetical protein n=1 Tax=Actinoplanes sp. HUAS TT8 TaxID=3447453 RepID=UPI003F51F729